MGVCEEAVVVRSQSGPHAHVLALSRRVDVSNSRKRTVHWACRSTPPAPLRSVNQFPQRACHCLTGAFRLCRVSRSVGVPSSRRLCLLFCLGRTLKRRRREGVPRDGRVLGRGWGRRPPRPSPAGDGRRPSVPAPDSDEATRW